MGEVPAWARLVEERDPSIFDGGSDLESIDERSLRAAVMDVFDEQERQRSGGGALVESDPARARSDTPAPARRR